MNMQTTFKSKVWLYKGNASWHFITVPTKQSEQIKYLSMNKRAAWGSVRVSTTIGKSTWQTSLFPSKELKAYILPIKAEIRKNEKIKVDDIATITLSVL